MNKASLKDSVVVLEPVQLLLGICFSLLVDHLTFGSVIGLSENL